MTVLSNFFSGFSAQNIHQMTRTKADAAGLVHSVNAAQHFAGRLGGIPNGWRI